MPCCMSTTSESQPAWAMTSAEKLDGMPSQLLTTARPSAQISRTRFARAIRPSLFAALSSPDPASYGGRCQAPPALGTCFSCFLQAEDRRLPSQTSKPAAIPVRRASFVHSAYYTLRNWRNYDEDKPLPDARAITLMCAVHRNGAVLLPGEVDFEVHTGCHQRRYASAARPVFKGDDADLCEALQGARQARLLAPREGGQFAHRSGPMALDGVEHGEIAG